ncbi:P-loop NTPase fold protein [Hymenobacter cavernae]|uniref:KAP NTPase domain-containing protein n=1 Tax=Hymenobacter cavernae TaxID=2044852 RepID=A0ABQ1TJ13_9BACT|nr:P-loop NTPase fold protein [Hymenobacter cavernae]GGE95195.1 hypothetical protein GCM10011383_02350 [Hymenobacter cavernae]
MPNLNHITEAVDKYLSSNTKYAVLITGKWGSGKTYFYENTLVKLIREKKVADSQTTFIPIRISLFGINSIEALESEISTELLPYLESKTIKTGGKLLFSAVRGYIKNKTEVDIKEYLPDTVEFDKNSLIRYERTVICFDDIERKSDGLSINQIIGYINSLTENNNTKVIILSNEGEITQDDYNKIKEKTIGVTLDFSQPIIESYDSLISDLYSTDTNTYGDFLLKNKSHILNTLKHTNDNLRIIITAIDKLHQVFTTLKNVDFISTNHQQQLDSIITFTLALSIQFSKRKISKNDKDVLSTRPILDLSKFYLGDAKNTSTTKSSKSKREKFLSKFYSNQASFVFIESIFNYITLSINLHESELIKDIEKLFPQPGEVEDPHLVLNQLEYINLDALTNQDYINKTNKIVQFAQLGKYDILGLFKVFHFVTRFDNLLELDLDDLTKKLIEGIDNNKYLKYQPSLSFQLQIPESNDNYTKLKEISKYAIEKNESLMKQEALEKRRAIVDLFINNRKEFYEEANTVNGDYISIPIFIEANPDEIFEALRSQPFNDLEKFKIFLKIKYKNPAYSFDTSEEELFFKNLDKVFTHYFENNKEKSLTNFQLRSIQQELLALPSARPDL